MYFAFGGEVIACCHNRKHILGKYPEQNIDEIWQGKEYKILRTYIEHDDLSYGCQVCKHAMLAQNFEGAKNKLYDRYKKRSFPQIFEFELDNKCNLACIICNPLFSSSITDVTSQNLKKSPYDKNFLKQIEKYIPHLKEAKFYGGEPFLISIYFDIWEEMLAHNPNIQILIQTNGSILNDRIKKILSKGKFNINISIDSTNKERFEKIRKNAHFEQVLENLNYFKRYCQKQGTQLGIIPTPNRINIYDLPELTNWSSSMKAYIYFNTLVTPLEFALWNLPSIEIEEMYKILSQKKINANNGIEKINAKHFTDFLKQFQSWGQMNENKEKIESKIQISQHDLNIMKNDFINNLIIALPINKKEVLLPFVNKALDEINANSEKKLFYAIMQKVSMKEILDEVQKMDIVELRKVVEKKMYEARNEFQLID
jgi:sulfatase maturation enzyme AslB (radical SAM superfamily)